MCQCRMEHLHVVIRDSSLSSYEYERTDECNVILDVARETWVVL
jgi:hypothetical protein